MNPINKINVETFVNVKFGKNVNIYANSISIGEGSFLGDDVLIEADHVVIGCDSKIEYGTIVRGLGGVMQELIIGDNCFIGFRNQILLPHFHMNDYSQLHNTGLHSGYMPLEIGYNCWIGQNSILNATEKLKIGNNVRIGTQSQLWTHVASGELLEGCTLYGNKPLVLEDNVWLVGGAVISPGLVLGKNSIIMTGSVVTKSTLPFHTYAGVPAKDVTEKLNFWNKMDIADKVEKMKSFVDEFIVMHPQYLNKIFFSLSSNLVSDLPSNVEIIVITDSVIDSNAVINKQVSFFDLAQKKYTKKRSKIEIDFIKFNLGFRARFIPFEV